MRFDPPVSIPEVREGEDEKRVVQRGARQQARKAGDSLSAIASAHSLTLKALLAFPENA